MRMRSIVASARSRSCIERHLNPSRKSYRMLGFGKRSNLTFAAKRNAYKYRRFLPVVDAAEIIAQGITRHRTASFQIVAIASQTVSIRIFKSKAREKSKLSWVINLQNGVSSGLNVLVLSFFQCTRYMTPETKIYGKLGNCGTLFSSNLSEFRSN